MPTINQNSTASIALTAGQWIDVKGTGVAVPQIGPSRGQPQTITNFGKVGPFDFAQTVSLTATGGELTYNIIEDWPDARAPVDATGSPTGQLKTPDGLVIDGFVDRPAGTTLVLDAPSTYAPLTISGAATIAITGSTAGASASMTVIADGSNVPTIAGATEWANSFGYLNTAGVPNRLDVWHDGIARRYAWSQAKTPAVTDTTAPTLSAASVAGSTLVLTYNETLYGTAPAASSFTVVGAGGVTQAPSAVSISGAAVILTLTTPAVAANTVTVSYTPPVVAPISDLQFNEAASLSARAVTNNSSTFLTVASNNANWSSLGSGDYTNSGGGNAYDAYAVMNQTLAAGADGWIEANSLNTTDSTIVLGFDAVGTAGTYAGYDYCVICSGVSGNLQYAQNNGTGTTIGTVATPSANTKVRLARFGGTVTIDESTNGGATWTTRYTFGGSSTGALYLHASTYTGRKIYDLSGRGVA